MDRVFNKFFNRSGSDCGRSSFESSLLNDEYYRRFQQWAFASDHRKMYIVGARVWVAHPEKVWEGALVTENFQKSVLKVVTDNGQVKEVPVLADDNLPPLRNPEILIGCKDLTTLSYLHEPAVLYNLQIRFCRDNAIYTYCGIVLVAINPYTEMSIYGPDTIWTYRGRAMGELEPHIFAVAEEAYTKLEREQRDQSIIVSGESGAGKTVSAKYAMRYFATVGGSTTETHVERKVLASSPIMEAIGNAKTIRNDNSSRFGKYIELHFTRNYTIAGASMRTYLLEKSRVVFQAPNERNYHIFYQLCAARESHPDLMLQEAAKFKYLEEEWKITGVNDKNTYEETVNALTTLGFSKDDLRDIMTLLAGILHLGNVAIKEKGDGDSELCSIPVKDKHLEAVCKLYQLPIDELRHWLCHRQIVSSRETVNKPMNVSEAQGARDALSKQLYAALFGWIVDMINRALRTSAEGKHRFIGVLDIYGFETFEQNSFEQFCINYANEKLQQQFNQHVFKLEQEEYMKEGIEWKFIDFYDNQPCIDLIESKLGVLDLLDDECRMPKGSDSSWAEKLYSKCNKWNHFEKPRFGTSSFVIRHFADKVNYDTYGFLEKNRDTIIEEQVNVLRTSTNRLLQKLFREADEEGRLSVPKAKVRVSAQIKPVPPTSSSSKNKKTVGSQFRDSLTALMTTLNATTPHYIRCIKPNDDKSPFQFNFGRTVQQLRACGVLETIRISAAGFPSRWLFTDFLKRYRALCNSKDIDRNDLRATCEKIVQNIIKDSDKYKLGCTKLFLRAGQVAYFERLRSQKLLDCCIKLQTAVRGFLVRKRYTRTLKATSTLQRYFRGFLGRRRVQRMRREKAAITIQKFARGWLYRRKYQKLRFSALGIQKYGRGFLARRKFNDLKRSRAAIIIQTQIRGWLCRKKYWISKNKVVIVQSAVRRFLARRKFRKMKREARSAEHLKKLNKGLEKKIISLQQKLGDITKENGILQEDMAKLKPLQGVNIELKRVSKDLKCKEEEISTLRGEMETLKEGTVQLKELIKVKVKEGEEREKKSLKWEEENYQLREETLRLKKELEMTSRDKEVEIKKRVDEEKTLLLEEFNQERAFHQNLLAEKDVLESRVDYLEREIQMQGIQNRGIGGHKRNLSDVSNISLDTTSLSDVGYVSVRTPNSGRGETPTPEQQLDIGLVLKLQQKLKTLESENHRLHSKVEAEQGIYVSNTSPPHHDALMLQELEIENSKLKNDLKCLRDIIANDAVNSSNSVLEEIARQLDAKENEVSRLKQENLQLRNAFSNRTQSTKNLVESSYSAWSDLPEALINEDGELVLAYEAQRKVIRQQAEELETKTICWEVEREELVRELERLRDETDKQRSILSSGLQSSGESFLKHEVARLSSENFDLQDKYDLKSVKCRQLQEQNLRLMRRLKEAGVDYENENVNTFTNEKVGGGSDADSHVPHVKKKERHYMGMFQIAFDNITALTKHITDLKPRIAITLLPGLPAYIMFMCIRYTDHINNEKILQALMLSFKKAVDKVVHKKASDLEVCVFWLSNTARFLHNLKQYSGDKHFAKENTHIQNEQSLRNFDLSEFRVLFNDLAIRIVQNIVRLLEDKVQPLAVPALLEHDALAVNPTKGRSASVTGNVPLVVKSLDELLSLLTGFHRTLTIHGVDQEIISYFFKQILYFLCASAMNNLLLRKDFCHFLKGMQIRCNLSFLEQWIREQQLQDPKILSMLAPITQASQLLQARKTDDDVEKVDEMCCNLSPNQIIKLLNLYTPVDDYDSRVPESFIEKMQEKLKERKNAESTLLMDTKLRFSIEVPFHPSDIRLEDIEVPPVLDLPMLKKL